MENIVNAEVNKILVVDDEEEVLKIVCKRLEWAGYSVLAASRAEKVLTILENEIPDLILLDIAMPDIDGIELCRKIKEYKYTSNVPIIFLTAMDSINAKIQGLKEGVYDYITKPTDPRELLARIESVLARSKHYHELSSKDELTGLYNYNCFQRHFAYVFDLAKRYRRIFSLGIMDIDNFKQINDRYGHVCGDFVLEKVGEKLKNSLRKVDMLFRYGGDEFVFILPETGNEQTGTVILELKQKLGNTRIVCHDHEIDVFLSFGISTYADDMATKEELFNMADKEMYKDKKEKSGKA